MRQRTALDPESCSLRPPRPPREINQQLMGCPNRFDMTLGCHSTVCPLPSRRSDGQGQRPADTTCGVARHDTPSVLAPIVITPATSDAARTTTTPPRGAIRSRGATPSGRGDGPPGTPTSPGMLVRLGGRQHVLALQRRRFWRELGFATAHARRRCAHRRRGVRRPRAAADPGTLGAARVRPLPAAEHAAGAAAPRHVARLLPRRDPLVLHVEHGQPDGAHRDRARAGHRAAALARAVGRVVRGARAPPRRRGRRAAARARRAAARDGRRAAELRPAPARPGAHDPRRRSSADPAPFSPSTSTPRSIHRRSTCSSRSGRAISRKDGTSSTRKCIARGRTRSSSSVPSPTKRSRTS